MKQKPLALKVAQKRQPCSLNNLSLPTLGINWETAPFPAGWSEVISGRTTSFLPDSDSQGTWPLFAKLDLPSPFCLPRKQSKLIKWFVLLTPSEDTDPCLLKGLGKRSSRLAASGSAAAVVAAVTYGSEEVKLAAETTEEATEDSRRSLTADDRLEEEDAAGASTGEGEPDLLWSSARRSSAKKGEKCHKIYVPKSLLSLTRRIQIGRQAMRGVQTYVTCTIR